MNIIYGALVTLILTLGGAAWFQTLKVDTLTAKLSLAQAELQTCGGRLDAILRDVRSDNEIDQLSDDALRDVPSHWLLPTDPASP